MNPSRKLVLILAAGLTIGLAIGGVIYFAGAMPFEFSELSVSGSNLQSGSPRIGQAAPPIDADWLEGGAFNEEVLVGRKTVLNFWATWCAPCQEEMPVMQRVFERYQPDLQVIGINADESVSVILPYLEKYNIDFDIAVDNQGKTQRDYAVLGLPITFFINEQGVIVAQHIGGVSKEQMAGYLEILGVAGD